MGNLWDACPYKVRGLSYTGGGGRGWLICILHRVCNRYKSKRLVSICYVIFRQISHTGGNIFYHNGSLTKSIPQNINLSPKIQFSSLFLPVTMVLILPSTNLWEGNVFSRVRHSVQRRGVPWCIETRHTVPPPPGPSAFFFNISTQIYNGQNVLK